MEPLYLVIYWHDEWEFNEFSRTELIDKLNDNWWGENISIVNFNFTLQSTITL